MYILGLFTHEFWVNNPIAFPQDKYKYVYSNADYIKFVFRFFFFSFKKKRNFATFEK